MGTPTQEQLIGYVVESMNVDELETRVSHGHGVQYVPAAKLLAVRLKGERWVFGELAYRSAAADSSVAIFLRAPVNAVVVVQIAALLGALLFPPRVLYLPDGLVVHTGFSFLLTAAESRNMGAVNVALLALELATILVVGSLCVYLIRRFNQASAAR